MIDFCDRILWLTQRRPGNRLIGAWELLKESFENCRTNCNECRDISSGSRSIPSYPSRNESSPQSNRNEVTYTAGGAEESDARSVRSEEQPELENLVVLGKGLRWSVAFSTETGNVECRKKGGSRSPCRTFKTLACRKIKTDRELRHFSISKTEGEALEVIRGAERESGLEQWRRLAALCDPLAVGRSVDDSRQILSPPNVSKIDDLSHAVQAWENFAQRHQERTEDQLPEDMRLAVLLSVCPTDHEELTAQQHLFPDYAQMRVRIVTVINSRTRGPAPMMGNLNEEASNHDAGGDESVGSEDWGFVPFGNQKLHESLHQTSV